ncbi:alpha/beta hydrolase [Chloroflexus sp.]|uniref:alpha/beta hydrolase n=1 Tax=Chloroflexus sp. TaxID=1904827 RepID=UPI002ACEEECC|nr:alpha/beta fold hydrolase [Chloroflexus sp.]
MIEPYLLRRGEHACLLIHGFVGDPGEMRDLAEHLAGAGYTVLGMRLPGHTGQPEDLMLVRWPDWLAAATHAFNRLSTSYATVSVIGFSLGGALAALLAAERPAHRLVMLATPYRLGGDWRVNVLGLARHVTPWFYLLAQADFSDPELRTSIWRRQPGLDLDDPAIQQMLRQSVKVSVAAADELRLALAAAGNALPRVRTPVLLMHGQSDTTADPASAVAIARRIGSAHCELVYWPATGHQLLVAGPYREAIFRRIERFLSRPIGAERRAAPMGRV